MAALSPASAAAIARLRSYVPPPTTWYSLPLTRRAAVLILLFADKKGDLRVVLTMRSGALRSYAGQAALPGGKTDALHETPLQTARREAFEEIGLPAPSYPDPAPAVDLLVDSDAEHSQDPSLTVPSSHPYSTKYSPPTPNLPRPFQLEHLCQLPTNLAKTELGVRPCVAFLSNNKSYSADGAVGADIETTLIPRLDAKEVAAVFSGPLHNFLSLKDEDGEGVAGYWYKGSWTDWHETRFRMHNFYVPVKGRPVTRPRKKAQWPEQKRKEAEAAMELQVGSKPPPLAISMGAATDKMKYPRASSTLPYRDVPQPYTDSNPDPLDTLERFRVFGMTARILVDCARVAYAEEPEFEHNSHFGDEAIIRQLIDVGSFATERDKGDEFVGKDLTDAIQGQSFGGLVAERKKKGGKI